MTNVEKKLLFSVSINDCEQQFFTCGKKGGGGKDTSNNGVRLIHHPSGAVAEARDTRSQKTNRRNAFLKLVETKEFKNWQRIYAARLMGQKTPAEIADEEMKKTDNFIIEVKDNEGKWQLLKDK